MAIRYLFNRRNHCDHFRGQRPINKDITSSEIEIRNSSPLFEQISKNFADEIKEEAILDNNVKQFEITQSLPCLPVRVVFDLMTGKHTGVELGTALKLVFDSGVLVPQTLRDTYKVVQSLFVKAILSHPNAKDISAHSLTIVLLKSIGTGYSYRSKKIVRGWRGGSHSSNITET